LLSCQNSSQCNKNEIIFHSMIILDHFLSVVKRIEPVEFKKTARLHCKFHSVSGSACGCSAKLEFHPDQALHGLQTADMVSWHCEMVQLPQWDNPYKIEPLLPPECIMVAPPDLSLYGTLMDVQEIQESKAGTKFQLVHISFSGLNAAILLDNSCSAHKKWNVDQWNNNIQRQPKRDCVLFLTRVT